ncbi:MAG: hypothetical protein KF791_04100 [Verrucomicrobiae bacterium]|nr:hypothetical protein [Verrucomicrobiae bacterium]
MTNVSSAILSWSLAPLTGAWLVSAAVFQHYRNTGSLTDVPFSWLILYFVVGPIAMFVAGMLIFVRLRERRRFPLVDRVALGVSAVCGAWWIWLVTTLATR